jgi:hypothetical protein
MTANSSSAVGQAAIDSYLDSVELALIDSDAPRSDRLQVLQDLEAQIADMLAGQPTPLTEESVRAVLDKLEPPSHFAATYGKPNVSTAPTSSAPRRSFRLTRPDWPIIATVGCAILVLGLVFGLVAANSGPNDLWIFLALACLLVGFVLTPIAIWKSYKRLRAEPGAPGRDLVLNSTIVYSVVVPILLMCFITALTEGFALILLGVALFFYFQYVLVRRLWRRMSDALPARPASAATGETNGSGASSPVNAGTPMPAL